MQSQPVAATLDRFNPGGFHWHTRIVEFQDVTDWNNNLVFETTSFPTGKTATGATCSSPATPRTAAGSSS